jgi:ubiquinone/menaquinone biosynthesis C-methylase UbiE
MKQRVKLFYNELAEDYDHLASQHYREMLLRLLREEFEGASVILDVGCGTGTLTSKLRGLKIGLELSPKLARIAKSRGIEIVIGDAESLPFVTNAFEAAICTDVLEHLNEPQKALKEMARVLKPHGKALITTPNPLWAPIIKMADALKLKFPEGPCRYLCPHVLDKMLEEVHLLKVRESGWTPMFTLPRRFSVEQVVLAKK